MEWNGGVDYWSGVLDWTIGVPRPQNYSRTLFHGLILRETTEKQIKSNLGCHAKPWGNVNSVEWNDGMERWSGLLEWSTGLDYWSATPTKLFNIVHALQ